MIPPSEELSSLIDALENIRRDMLHLAERCGDALRAVHPDQRASARNLLHYLALRGHDLRPLQARLAAAGLSSLGRAESHSLSAIDQVLSVLYRLSERPMPERDPLDDEVDLAHGQSLLETHTEAALGTRPPRGVSIMVTMPSEAADDYTLVAQLLKEGMDCIRINCAHDNAGRWAGMVENLRRATERTGRSCRILMDLAGPKIRTGPIEPGPAVVRIRPQRDERGRVTEPAHVWLFAEETPTPSPTPASAALPVESAWLAQLGPGDRIHLVDARDAERKWTVVAADADGCWAEVRKTCYVEPGTALRADRPDGSIEARIGALTAPDKAIHLSRGDEIVITRPDVAGRNAVRSERGTVLTPASIGCTAFRDTMAQHESDAAKMLSTVQSDA